MGQEFKDKGWCFVKLPPKFPYSEIEKQLAPFFSKSEEYKAKHSGPYGFGYSEVPHKEGLRLLTGNRLFNDFLPNGFVPTECSDFIQQLSRVLDDLTMRLTLAISQPIFGRLGPSLAKNADIPVAYSGHFGMLDTALYHNQKTSQIPLVSIGTSVDDVNCVPHYDPGLISLSFFSNNEGLQLQDPKTGNWIAGPVNTIQGQEDIAVIWLGEAAVKASKLPLKAGIHRVVYPQVAKPRLTVWYEMCTVKQATEPDQSYVNPGSVNVPNLPGSLPVEVKEGEKVVDILRKIERTRGIPMSKVRRLDDSFKRWDPNSE